VIFHFAIIDPDIENLVRRIAETGGKSRSQIWRFFPDKLCEDPFGNTIEIYSHSTEQTWSNA